ncbi:tRNA pseudouridine(55) synthase TruB [Mesomycoplasma ovipneumoniae]|uniref:tRNA pseudouridine(55) synthase TruB n=1 Tax=Mesomycoplasma ovipneumoniae TaxID=29562 RepID=UPI0029645823|nr:tRNA pseudouridine(55) synthase TruB [Mesomycoplasma ovipneumoniae]MDW2930832.1 tRNA pseudouridine(55) synthase TruB [Mesomycoplasma ovipneumoniae]
MVTFLYKPKNISSATFLRKWAKINSIKKAGHSGTLDPFASGLLLVATDDDTKLLPYLDQENKTYIAQVNFGFYSTTFDIDGEIFACKSPTWVTKTALESKLLELEQLELQVPPIFSSKKISGKRAYEYARNGKDIELAPIKIKISKTILLEFNEKKQIATILWEVSKGCYIRSLASDLGKMLKTGGYLSELERVKIGNFDFSFVNLPLKIQNFLDFPQILVNSDQLIELLNGKKINYFTKDSEFIQLVFDEHLVGFGKIINNELIPKKIFGNKVKNLIKI